MARRLGFISDPRFVKHDPSGVNRAEGVHPERPDRLRAVHRAVRAAGLVASPDPFPEFELDLGPIVRAGAPAVELPFEAASDEALMLCHPREHLERVAAACRAGAALDEDTLVTDVSEEIARAAVGAAIAAVDAVLDETVDRCFVAVRPPGHHAEPDRAMGFCLYSTVAIAARHAVVRRGLKRVAIFDFDVHHGNGTQACLAGDPAFLFVSTHQSPQTCYPGTGFATERGVGAAEGLVLNIPLEPGTGPAAYEAILREKVIPAIGGFRPELILLSAGFDAHEKDPLAQVCLDDRTFSTIGMMMCRLAETYCDGKMVAVLEGGYDLGALARGVVRVMVEMGR